MSNAKYKQCFRCKQMFEESLENFGFNKRLNKYNALCRECVRNRDRDWRRKKGILPKNKPLNDNTKGCKKCGRVLPIDSFSIMNNGRYRPYCKECRSSYSRTYVETHYEHHQLSMLRRDDRVSQVPFDLLHEEWLEIIKHFNYRCAVCKVHFDRKITVTLDHWIPVSSTECPGTVTWNSVPMCRKCNSRKYNKPALNWLVADYGHEQGNKLFLEIQSYLDGLKNGNTKRDK